MVREVVLLPLKGTTVSGTGWCRACEVRAGAHARVAAIRDDVLPQLLLGRHPAGAVPRLACDARNLQLHACINLMYVVRKSISELAEVHEHNGNAPAATTGGSLSQNTQVQKKRVLGMSRAARLWRGSMHVLT